MKNNGTEANRGETQRQRDTETRQDYFIWPERDRETKRPRETERETETDRETETETDRETEIERERQRRRQTETQTGRDTDRLTDTERGGEKQIDRQTDTERNRETEANGVGKGGGDNNRCFICSILFFWVESELCTTQPETKTVLIKFLLPIQTWSNQRKSKPFLSWKPITAGMFMVVPEEGWERDGELHRLDSTTRRMNCTFSLRTRTSVQLIRQRLHLSFLLQWKA